MHRHDSKLRFKDVAERPDDRYRPDTRRYDEDMQFATFREQERQRGSEDGVYQPKQVPKPQTKDRLERLDSLNGKLYVIVAW